MRTPGLHRALLAWLAPIGIGLSGCAAPDMQTPPAAPPLPARFSIADTGEPQAVAERWWTAFGDERLDALVDQALIANQDVGIALAHVRAARAGLQAQTARTLPAVGLQGTVSRTESGLPQAVKQAGEPDTRAYRAGVDLSWEIDLAGGVGAARDAAGADAAASTAGLAGARLLVASEVARQYFILQGARQKLALVEALADSQRATAERVATRVREGQASRFDLERAQAEADGLAAQAAPLRMLVGATQNRLAVLTGKFADGGAFGATEAYAWPAARAIAIGQPRDLLRRRPDLMAAERRYDAETLRGAEARANLWPKLFVQALLGREGLRLNALDLAPVRFSSVALAFGMPLLNRGQVLAGIEAQSARADEALLSWQRATLVAVEEVEDALLLRAQEARRASSLRAAVQSQARALDHARSLRREGQIDALALLDVQRGWLAAQLALADSQAQQALDDVQLCKALGGGWRSSELDERAALPAHTRQIESSFR